MTDDQKAGKATPAETLEQHIIDPNIPKNEAEWWAHRRIEAQAAEIARLREALELAKAEIRKLEYPHTLEEWPLGLRVTKIRGSKWTGRIVGYYSTDLTPVGLAIESETETGSVQIYPVAAIRKWGENHDPL